MCLEFDGCGDGDERERWDSCRALFGYLKDGGKLFGEDADTGGRKTNIVAVDEEVSTNSTCTRTSRDHFKGPTRNVFSSSKQWYSINTNREEEERKKKGRGVDECQHLESQKVRSRSLMHLARSPLGFPRLPNTALHAFKPSIPHANNSRSALCSTSSIVSSLPPCFEG